jgi:hypothetical protein
MQRQNLPASIRRFHAIIEDVSDERDNEDGYWVYLKSGWINKLHEVHMVHEDTLAECADQLKNFVETCSCDDCKHA